MAVLIENVSSIVYVIIVAIDEEMVVSWLTHLNHIYPTPLMALGVPDGCGWLHIDIPPLSHAPKPKISHAA